MITQSLLAMFASFAFVFFKAFQQRNVAFDHYRWVLPTSMVMAMTEFYVVALIATHGYQISIVLAAGLGAGLGALLAIWIHGRFITKKQHVNVSTSLTAQGAPAPATGCQDALQRDAREHKHGGKNF